MRSATTGPVVEIALQIATINTSWVARAVLASDDLIKAERVGNALVALFTSHARWTNTISSFFLADSSRGTVARFAVGESVEAGLASLALTSNNVLFALTLAAKLFALKARGTVIVASARQCAAVVVGCQREHGLFAEIGGVQLNVEMLLATFLDKLLGFIKLFFVQQIVVELISRHHQDVIQPNAFGQNVTQCERKCVLDVEPHVAVVLLDEHSTPRIGRTVRNWQFAVVVLFLGLQAIDNVELRMVWLVELQNNHIMTGLGHFGVQRNARVFAIQIDHLRGVVNDVGQCTGGAILVLKFNLLRVGGGQECRWNALAVLFDTHRLWINVIHTPLLVRNCRYRLNCDIC